MIIDIKDIKVIPEIIAIFGATGIYRTIVISETIGAAAAAPFFVCHVFLAFSCVYMTGLPVSARQKGRQLIIFSRVSVYR